MARTPDLEKRKTIAWDAFEYLRSKGTSQVTMTELARALNMKRPSLYWYFPDLASVFDVILDETFGALDAHVGEALLGIEHPIDLLYGHIKAVHAFHQGREEDVVFLFQFWAAGSPDEPDRALQRIKTRYMPLRAAGIALLQDGIERGLVAPCDPEAVIGLVGAITDGLLIQRVIADADLDPIHDLIWKQLLAPLRLQPAPQHVTP